MTKTTNKKITSKCFVEAAGLIDGSDIYHRYSCNALNDVIIDDYGCNSYNLFFLHYQNMFNTNFIFDFQWDRLEGCLPSHSQLEEPRRLALLLAKAAWDAGDRF